MILSTWCWKRGFKTALFPRISIKELTMIKLKAPLRRARPDDARALAELADQASYGLAPYFWDKIKEPGQTALDAGVERAGREEGSFSYRNAIIAEMNGKCAACLIGYPQEENPEPVDRDSMPPMLVPLQELENMAPETWYVNVLAAYPEARNKGLGRMLLEAAEQIAQEAGKSGLSLIAEDDNVNAIRLYHRFGFRDVATRPIIREGWHTEGENWILMKKALPTI
jgi:ribosomal protein S18 acetylase RimI-like enzyme